MKTLAEQDVFDKKFAYQIAMMIESGLITPRYYIPWAQEISGAMEQPLYWILELSMEENQTLASHLAQNFAFSGVVEAPDDRQSINEYMACVYLRHKRGEISWATFLLDAANNNFRFDFEVCRQYRALSDDYAALLASGFSKEIEENQREKFEQDYAAAIATIEPLYQGFLEYFRRNREVGVRKGN